MIITKRLRWNAGPYSVVTCKIETCKKFQSYFWGNQFHVLNAYYLNRFYELKNVYVMTDIKCT